MVADKPGVIVPCYNKVEGVIDVTEGLLSSDKYSTIVLLDLYSPDPKTRSYISCIADLYDDRIILVDPGKKISLSDGLNLASSKIKGEYVILNDHRKDEYKIQSVKIEAAPKVANNPFQFRKDTKRTKSFIAPGRFKGGNSF